MGFNTVGIKDVLFEDGKHPTIFVLFWASRAVGAYVRVLTKHTLYPYTIPGTTDRTLNTAEFRVTDYPMNVVATRATPGTRRGEIFIQVLMQLSGVATATLISGYLTDISNLNWPPGKLENFTDGAGLLRSIAGTDPAAGSEISESVPTNARWQLRSMRFSLVTSADVGDRRPGIIVDDGTSTLLTRYFGVTQAASLTRTYEVHFGEKADDGAFDAGNIARIYLPPKAASLLQGWRIRTTTVGLFAADNYGAPQLNAEEWIEE